MKKILITGANSYIGTSFENYIKSFNGYAVDTVDMIDGSWRKKDFSGYDTVFHVAGLAHKKETKENESLYYTVNADLAYNVCKKAKESGVKQFVFLSSMSVYGKFSGEIEMNTNPLPVTNYGKSKLMGEEKISSLANGGFKVVILRPPMVYGKGCKGNYNTLSKIAKRCPFFPYILNERSMIYIDNLLEFVRLIVKNEESGVFFPQNKEYSNTSEMVNLIAAAHGKKIMFVKGFSGCIRLLSSMTGIVNKAFGSLYYDKSMSEYREEYSLIDLKKSIRLTEGIDG